MECLRITLELLEIVRLHVALLATLCARDWLVSGGLTKASLHRLADEMLEVQQ